jgi:hypothetical protein
MQIFMLLGLPKFHSIWKQGLPSWSSLPFTTWTIQQSSNVWASDMGAEASEKTAEQEHKENTVSLLASSRIIDAVGGIHLPELARE